jgi:hypothetical protein
VLEVYCDESIADLLGAPGLWLAGYLASDENWASFSQLWRTEVLEPYSIPHLHAVELRSRHASLYRHLDLDARRKLLATACDIIVSCIEAGFVAYMRPAEFERLTAPEERARWGGAYGVCTEVLVGEISRHVGRPERVSFHFENGHANVASAMKRIDAIKADTELIEWPKMADADGVDAFEHIEKEMRISWMRIGTVDTVTKTEALPTQAADLLAYLSATVMRNDNDPVYEGYLDLLIGRKPHAFRSLGARFLAELVEVTRFVEQRRLLDRTNIYNVRGTLHSLGYATYVLPWGLVVDKGPKDERFEVLRQQVEEILKRIQRRDPSSC